MNTNQATSTEAQAAEQKKMHADTVGKLAQVFAENIGDMTKLTAMNVAIDFTVAALVYVFETTGTLGELDGKTVGDEVARRIVELKKAGK